MSDILFTGSESFEVEFENEDYPSVTLDIATVRVRFHRYVGFTKEYLQSDLTTFSTSDNYFLATAQDANFLIWRYTLTLPSSMVGFNIFITFSPYDSSVVSMKTDIGDPADDFYVQFAADDLTIATYKRDLSESFRAFTSGTGYVRGSPNFSMTGVKSVGTAGFQLVYNSVTYTAGDGFLVDSGTTWTWTGPAGTETSPGSPRTVTLNKTGSVSKTVSIIVDRTAPSLTLAISSTFGQTVGSPMRRGEYIFLNDTASDANSGLSLATVALTYGTSSDWTSPPATMAINSTSTLFRSSSTSPISVTTSGITGTVTDNAGNSTAITISAFFTTLPSANTVSGAVTSANQSPLTLFFTTPLVESPTDYTNVSVTATITPNAPLPVCRNSGTDNTLLGIQTGTLTVTTTNVAGAAAASQSVTANVSSQASALARTITPRLTDQNYRTATGTTFGSFDYNANKSIDIGTEPTLVAPFGGLNKVYAETLYDAYVPLSTAQRGLLSKEANISVTGGQATTSSASTNNRFVVRIQLPTNNATNNQYGVKLRGPAGELSAVDGVSVETSPVGAGTYTSRTLGSTFTGTTGATAIDVRVTIGSIAANSQIAGIFVGVIE